MTNNTLQKRSKAEIAKDFRVAVTEVENVFRANENGYNVIVGTKDNPIVPNSALCSTESVFAEGVYAREMSIKKGCVVIGAIHKHEHISFLLSGSLTVASENGMAEHVAPCVIVAGPGVKRMAYANEDSIWWNVHGNPSNTRDLKELENENIVATYEEYEEYIKNK